jgi:phosphomannomutase
MSSSSSSSLPASTIDRDQIDALVEKWLRWDKVDATRKEIESLRASSDYESLSKCLSKRISFGTAGLRGLMAAGFANMNKLTVWQATQGLYVHMSNTFGVDELQRRGVVIGYDGRHNSLLFARTTASVFLSKGVHVYLYSTLVATPLVPFGVLQLGACGGVMVTASHNPKQDNGYKVYWHDGCQIVSPHDKHISDAIEANTEPWPIDSEMAALNGDGDGCAALAPLLADPTESMGERYNRLIGEQLCRYRDDNAASTSTPIVFTPMHGVGSQWMKRAFEAFSLPAYVPVPEQAEPDAEFSTVVFPNPEEGAGALKLAMEAADRARSDIIIANDPDSDRLAFAERDAAAPGGWRVFSGNEIGIMLAAWTWQEHRRERPDEPPERSAMLNTTVSSKQLAAMAAKEGFYYEETLTGFKWLGSRAIALAADGKRFLFAFEEAIGFLIGDLCLDKDGIRAGAVFAEMAVQLYEKRGTTFARYLDSLHERYGYHETNNSYFFCHHPPTMYAIFERLRTLGQGGAYADRCGRFAVRDVRDLMTGFDSAQPDNKAVLPVSKSSPMSTFYFENGAVVTIRGSGTEPKLKYYAELSGGSREQVHRELNELVDAIVQEFLQPEKNNLGPRSN